MTDTTTPTTPLPAAADLVTDAPPDTPEWFAARRSGITATDLPKILGVSAYGNAVSVWADKLGLTDPDAASESGKWGRLLEPVIADDWADEHGVPLHKVGILANTGHPWRRAALDRVTDHCPDDPWSGPCPVEVKTRSAWKGAEWRDDIPDDVLAQVTWQMIVTGWDHVHVAALIGGQERKDYRVDRDDDITRMCLAEAERVWGHVQDMTRPHVDPDELLGRVLDALYRDRDGAVTLTWEQAQALAANYADACTAVKDAEAEKVAARAAILDVLGGAETAAVVGADGSNVPVFTYKQTVRKAYTKTVPESTYRTLRVVKGNLK